MGGRGQRKDKSTQKFIQSLLGVSLGAHANPPPAVPEEAKRAKELYSAFINKGKRCKAWRELEKLELEKPCSALCITAAKMHMIAAVEQVCKAEEEGAREAAALTGLHRVLEYAVHGALQYCSIQCLVLAVFTLHTCRGRGSLAQLRWRRQQAEALEAQFEGPAAHAAKWGKTKWVDPRIESYDKDRFPFEWEPYSSKNLKEWIEAVRDDWNKFMPTIARADQLAEEQLSSRGRDNVGDGSSSCAVQQQRGLEKAAPAGRAGEEAGDVVVKEELATPVDVRLAGSFALKHCDKDAVRRHLDGMESKRKPHAAQAVPPPPLPKPAPTPASTRAGRAATAAAAAAVVQLAAAAGKEERGSGGAGVGLGPPPLPAPAPAPYSRGTLADSSLLLPHQPAGKGRERHRAEQKRQQAQRAQQRAAEIQAYLSGQLACAGEDQEAAQRLLADSCSMGVAEFAAAVKAAVACKELAQAEADLAMANLARLRGEVGGRPQHVWYGDPRLDTGDRRHEVEGQQEMETLLAEHLQQDWMVAEEATDWVGSHLDGWRELLTRMGLDANTMTQDVDRDSMLAQEDPSLGQTLVRVWTEDYAVPPPHDVGAEVDEAADAELEALLPAGARPCSCGRCQREQQQQQQQLLLPPPSSDADRDAIGSGKAAARRGGGDGKPGVEGEEACISSGGSRGASQPSTPTAAGGSSRRGLPAAGDLAAEQCRAEGVGGAGSSPSRVQLAQQQWREAMHSEEYGSVLQLDVYINEAERSQQYLDSILGRPEGLMQQCRVLAANPEGAPSNEADELVRRAMVGHLMLRLAGAWDSEDSQQQEQQRQQRQQQAHDQPPGSSAEREGVVQPATAAAAAAGGRVGVAQTLHLLRRAMDPSCNLEGLIMDCAVGEASGRAAVAKLGQLREAELAAEAAASKAWSELAAAMQTKDGSSTAPPANRTAAGAEAGEGCGMVDAREEDGAISRPVTFCTPLLTTVLEGAVAREGSGQQRAAGHGGIPHWEQERHRLRRAKAQLARSALLGLGQIWRRRRLTDKMSFQLCQFIADSLATCGELSTRPAEREVLRRAAERLLVGPAPAPCVLRLAGWLPLRVLRHLYTFVVLLVGECFASPQDLSAQVEDLVYADASAGALSEDGSLITVRPTVFAALNPVQPAGSQGGLMDSLALDSQAKKKGGRVGPFGTQAHSSGECSSLLLSPLRAECEWGEGVGGGNWLARVAAYVCAPSEAQQSQQAQQEGGREEVVGDLHKLWHVEGVLLGLANLCEYWERGLDDSLARMEALRTTLEQVVCGGKDAGDSESPSPAKGPFVLEQQLLEARKVLQATEAVELSLRLAVIRMHGFCFEGVLRMLRDVSSGAAPELELRDTACTAAAISKFECMLRDSSAEGEACRARMQELAAAPAPALEGKELETVRALGLVLGGGHTSQNGRPPAAAKVRALLAACPERWEASLAGGRELVLATLRRLDECTEALATLGEWCYIKQCSLVGQLRSQHCTHSCGDEIVGVLLRLLATQRWEPAILAEQEAQRSALARALESELEAEREREVAARAAKRAQKEARQRAAAAAAAAGAEPEAQELQQGAAAGAHAATAGSEDGSSSEEEGEELQRPEAPPPAGLPMAQAVGSPPVEGTWVTEILARQQLRAAAAAQPWQPAQAQHAQGAPALRLVSGKGTKHVLKPAAPAPPREVMRIVTHMGDWLCSCGTVNKLWDGCACKQDAPCRDWVRGVCSLPACRFPHPPFDLPSTTRLKKSERIANPAPDAPIYSKLALAASGISGATVVKAGVQQQRGGIRPAGAAAAVGEAKSGAQPAGAASTRPLGSSGSSSGSLTGVGQHLDAALLGAWGAPPPPPTFAAAVAGVDAAKQWVGRGAPHAQQPAAPAQPLGGGSSNGSTPPNGRVSPTPDPAPNIGAAGAMQHSSAAAELPPAPSAAATLAAAAAAAVNCVSALPAAPSALGAALPSLLPVALPGSLEAALSHPPQAWGSAGLPLGGSERAEQEDDEEALFSRINSQLLQGLGLGEPEDFAPLPLPTPPHTPPPAPDPVDYSADLLGSVVLCLWYCTEFREQVAAWRAPVYMGHPVVKALYSLFHSLAEACGSSSTSGSPQRKGPGSSPGPLGRLEVEELREALSALPAQMWPGESSPAAVLLSVYGRIQEVAAMRGIPSADPVFGIPVSQCVQCRSCGSLTRRRAGIQYMLSIQAAALREQRQAVGGDACGMGRMLRLVADQAKLSCDKDAGGCGVLNSVSQALQPWVPRVFTLQLGWGKQREEGLADIAATLREVQEQLDLCELYLDLGPARLLFHLRSMVCSGGSGGHRAFVLVRELGGWLSFDNTQVSHIGTFENVRQKCKHGRLMPILLFYEAAQ